MTASTATKKTLVGIFIAIICLEGPVQAVRDWRDEGSLRVTELVTQTPTQENLRRFERDLEGSTWSGTLVRPYMQYLRFLLFEDFGAKVLPGRDGWLFYRPGVDFLLEPWSGGGKGPEDDPLRAMVNFRDQLALRDIALLVVIAPGKASVYPERLSGRLAGPQEAIHANTGQFMTALDAAGIAYVDLHAVYARARKKAGAPPFYLARDTHWSPEGLSLAANAVAARILEEGWIQPGTAQFTTRPVTVAREGDILRMADSIYIRAAFVAEQVTCAQVIDVESAELYADDPDSPVLLLGDSFLRIYQNDTPGAAGFIAHLARNLRRPLASVVNDGGASTLVRQELARRPKLLDGKQLVVWEFVERDLRFGTEGWQHVNLR